MTLGVIALARPLSTSPTVQAQDNENNDEEQLIHIGYAITPVPLNLEEKNSEQRRLVGLGSFIVNAQADCNGCHTAGGSPNFNYANNGNPYFLNQPLGTKTDPHCLLGRWHTLRSGRSFKCLRGRVSERFYTILLSAERISH